MVLSTLEGAERHSADWSKGGNAKIQPDVLSLPRAEPHAADPWVVGSASSEFLPGLWLASKGD